MAQHHAVGCLLGTAVGDALGLPYEGLSRERAARMLGTPDRHRFLLGRGMVSDDTEHTCMVAQAFLAASGDLEEFRRSLAWRLRWWLLGVPAGVGLATLRATVRLWFGVPPDRSGVFSAGNGPAMRAAVLGVALGETGELRTWVGACSRTTHTDPKAEAGALAVALAAHMACAVEPVSAAAYSAELRALLKGEAPELQTLVEHASASAARGETTEAFAASLGLDRGVSGYVLHSVPVALHAWFAHPRDFRSAVGSVIRCGGDADTTAAIVGGIVGAAVGKGGIPREWLDGLFEWPRSVAWMERLGEQLCLGSAGRRVGCPIWGVPARNLLFVVVVLIHGLRRLFPPF